MRIKKMPGTMSEKVPGHLLCLRLLHHTVMKHLIICPLIIPAGYEAVFKQFVEKTYAIMIYIWLCLLQTKP